MSRLFFGARLGLNGGSRGGFTPSILPSLKLWLPADRISGLVDGDPVTTWADLSGQGNHATQGTGAAKPLYKVGIANGRPGVLFDGVDDFMSLTAGAATAMLTGDHTVFAVVKWVTFGSDGRIVTVANGTASTRFSLRHLTGPVWNLAWTTGAAGFNASFSAGDIPSAIVPQVVECVQSGANISGLLNGTTGVSNTNAGTEAAAAQSMGANGSGAASFGNLYLMEFITYSAGLSAADRARVRRYLGARWGVAVS